MYFSESLCLCLSNAYAGFTRTAVLGVTGERVLSCAVGQHDGTCLAAEGQWLTLT